MKLDIKKGVLEGTVEEFKEFLNKKDKPNKSNSSKHIEFEEPLSNDIEFVVTSVPMYTSSGYVDKGVVLKKVDDDYLGTTWMNSKGKKYKIGNILVSKIPNKIWLLEYTDIDFGREKRDNLLYVLEYAYIKDSGIIVKKKLPSSYEHINYWIDSKGSTKKLYDDQVQRLEILDYGKAHEEFESRSFEGNKLTIYNQEHFNTGDDNGNDVFGLVNEEYKGLRRGDVLKLKSIGLSKDKYITKNDSEYTIPKGCITKHRLGDSQYHNIKYFYHNNLNIYKIYY